MKRLIIILTLAVSCTAQTLVIGIGSGGGGGGGSTPAPVYTFFAWCTGALPANTTLFVLSPATGGVACGTALAGGAVPMPANCVVKSLTVGSNAGGTLPTSGLIQLQRAPVNTNTFTNTTSTCTLGTGTSCQDTADAPAFNQGDRWRIVFTPAVASDTGGNVGATLVCG